MLAAVMPLPRLLATPPVTKTYFDMGQGSSGVFLMLQKSGPRRDDPGRSACMAHGARSVGTWGDDWPSTAGTASRAWPAVTTASQRKALAIPSEAIETWLVTAFDSVHVEGRTTPTTENIADMSEQKRELAGQSNKLLDALRHLKKTEERKREVPISTPAFHELANDVNATSREIFRIARDQDELGDAIPTGSDTIDDVDRDGADGSGRET